MKKSIALITLLFLLLSASFAQTKLLRHPSYHDGKIAFSYLGDIWVVNEDGSNLQRLTVHKARDIYPRFSPDGKWIAFSSNRAGNYDVYVIPSTGGAAKQLTFNSASDTVVGWSNDSKRVIFTSSRGLLYPGIPNLYEVSVEGTLEQPLPTDWGYWGSYNGDGSKFVYNRHPMVWWRKHYRGTYAADLWVMDVSSKKSVHINADDEYKGNNFWPMFAGSDIYFVADRLSSETGVKPGSAEVMKSINNIWKVSAAGGKPVQITHHTDGNLFWPSISSDGKTIVYEENFGLWKLDVATGKTKEIKVNVVSDDKENMAETLTVRGETQGYSLSPTNRRVAISAHGEIFTVAVDRGDVQQVTDSYSRETQPSWSPDGKWIAYVSDKSGQDEIWVAHENGSGARKLTNASNEKTGLRWSPDSKSLLYATSNEHKLYKMDVESGQSTALASSDEGNIQGAQWSPDGKWVAFSKQDSEFRPHVFVVSAAGGEEKRIGDVDSERSELEPIWTRDGKKIIFLSGDNQQGAATVRRSSSHLWSVSLQKEEKNPTDRGVDSEEDAAAADRAARSQRGAAGGGEGADSTRSADVKIDFDGIGRRQRQLTRGNDNVTSATASPDGRQYAFVMVSGDAGPGAGAGLYTINEDGTGETRVYAVAAAAEDDQAAGGPGGRNLSSLTYGRDGRAVYFLEGNTLNYIDVGGGGAAAGATAARAGAAAGGRATGAAPAAAPSAGGTARRVNFTVHVKVDHHEEWKEVFGESWRIMKNRFYDGKMHGADWNAAKAMYEPLMDYVGDQEEMHNVVSQMIGEINGSHTGISAPPSAEERDHAAQTRYPGFELAADSSGYYKIAKIYKGGPADHDYVKLDVGNFVLAVDGHALKSGDNYWKNFNEPRGASFEFTVNSKPSQDGAWSVKITPVNGGAYATLQYEAWVADRKALVDKLSNGQIGYLHIRQMNAQSLAKFEQDLVELHEKKALIIDQRFNPGGGIDQELLEILQQKQFQFTRNRDSITMTRPQRGFFGPMVVMENERSTSDAEVFPDGFRTLGLGKVVGVSTYGAVIGTGAYTLMDGSSIRTPANGLYSVKGYNLENYGVPPDVYVDNTPDDFLAGRDAQIIKAVEILKAQIK